MTNIIIAIVQIGTLQYDKYRGLRCYFLPLSSIVTKICDRNQSSNLGHQTLYAYDNHDNHQDNDTVIHIQDYHNIQFAHPLTYIWFAWIDSDFIGLVKKLCMIAMLNCIMRLKVTKFIHSYLQLKLFIIQLESTKISFLIVYDQHFFPSSETKRMVEHMYN